MAIAEPARGRLPAPVEAQVDQREPLPATAPPAPGVAELVEQDLLVEDVSIDGMCGVY